ncbi:MAG UNVERIFIED_CONTAM: hypothetical protein LVR18_38320 [Planctomycetaceae bacterium]
MTPADLLTRILSPAAPCAQLQWYFDWPNLTPSLTTGGDVRTTSFTYNDTTRLSYTVRLVVTDSQGTSSFTEQQVLVGRPTVPVVQRPFTVTTDRTPEIRWSASPAKYKVILKRAGSPDVTLAENLSTTSFTPTTDLALGNYNVVVIASNSMGQSVRCGLSVYNHQYLDNQSNRCHF